MHQSVKGFLVSRKIPSWEKEEEEKKEEDGGHSFCYYGAINGVFLEMLYHEVFKTEPSFSNLESFGLRRYFVFKDIGNHVFDNQRAASNLLL